jgi:REP element-mobilizing transposase RayT
MEWGESIIMPDHFHALIRIRKGGSLDLGNIIGGFKAGVSREWRRDEVGKEGKAGFARTGGIVPALPREMRIWHRNYYEMIVRSAEAEAKISHYIRMNPWRCVQELGNGLCGMGNPALWNAEKLGVLCSRNAPRPKSIPKAAVYLGGFHSPMEQEIFLKLLEHKRPVIWCPAWGLERAAFAPGAREALEQNRMLILEMCDTAGNLAAAEARNRFVLKHADQRWIPHVQSGGMLDRLLREG